MESGLIGRNVRMFRRDRGMSQAQLAAKANLSRAGVQKIEQGKSQPRAQTLRSIGDALDVSMFDLVANAPPLEKVRFRSRKKLKIREGVLAEAGKRLADCKSVEDMVFGELSKDILGSYSLMKRPNLIGRLQKEFAHGKTPRSPDAARAKTAADATRARLGLQHKEPIRDIAGLLEEKAGVRVLAIVRASDGYFGMSVADEDLGPAIAVNTWDRISVERWIFTAAHEMGHLILHPGAYRVEDTDEHAVEEKEADLFAAQLLMPDGLFCAEWNDTKGRDLVSRVLKIKQIFRVSYKTVLYRLSERPEYGDGFWDQFHVLWERRTGVKPGPKDEVEPMGRQDFSEALRSREPRSMSDWDFESDRLALIVRAAIEHEVISVSRGAEILRISVTDLRERMVIWAQERKPSANG